MAAGNLQPVKVIARILILSERRVQKLASEGILPKPARGMYDLIECVMAYIRYQRKSIDEKPSSNLTVLDQERTRLTKAKADLAELAERKRRGDLIEADLVQDFLGAIFTRVRQGVLSLPSRAAPKCHDAKTIPEVEKIILDCAKDALAEIAATKVDLQLLDTRAGATRAHRAGVASDPSSTA